MLTTQQGMPVGDDQNSLRGGDRGPPVGGGLQHFREKIFHFDHERIPERVVHARGFGAHGFFENYEPLSEADPGRPVPAGGASAPRRSCGSRRSPGSLGSFDLARDVRGFAVKLYTQEGNWDLVGNNIPVFFIQDPIKFPDIIHAVKAEPDRGFPQAQSAHDNFWDFVSLMPESTHMLLWVMSDRAIPRSFRFMEGFGVHTFRFVNARGKSTFVKFHWKPQAGHAVGAVGRGREDQRRRSRLPPPRPVGRHRRRATSPEWELCVQTFDDDFADRFEFDVLDPTKLIPEEVLPVEPIGRLVLDRIGRQLLRRDRAGRRSAPRTSSRASTSPTTRCSRAGTSPTSTPSSSASAARTSPTSRSTHRSARWPTSSRTGTWP